MAGVETLEHIDGLSAPDFPYNNPGWTHNKKVRLKRNKKIHAVPCTSLHYRANDLVALFVVKSI